MLRCAQELRLVLWLDCLKPVDSRVVASPLAFVCGRSLNGKVFLDFFLRGFFNSPGPMSSLAAARADNFYFDVRMKCIGGWGGKGVTLLSPPPSHLAIPL